MIHKTLVNIRKKTRPRSCVTKRYGYRPQGFPELPQRPFRCGMGRDVVVEHVAGSDLHDNERAESKECGGNYHEEIAGHHGLRVVVDDGQPALFRVSRGYRTACVKVLPTCM